MPQLSRGQQIAQFIRPLWGAGQHVRPLRADSIVFDFSKSGEGEAEQAAPSEPLAPDEDDPYKKIVYVGNLKKNLTKSAFEKIFEGYGTVLSTRRKRGNTYGHARFGTSAEAFDVLNKLNGTIVDGNPVRTDFSWQPKRIPADM